MVWASGRGADSLHRVGFRVFGERLPEYAKIVFDHCNIIFGVGTIENEFDQSCRIEVLPAEEIFDKEPELLRYAKSRMPRLLFPETYLWLRKRKNFSGCGRDATEGGSLLPPPLRLEWKTKAAHVCVWPEEREGRHLGWGKGELPPKPTLEKLDTNATYFNMITSTVLGVGKIPMVMEDDKLAIQTAFENPHRCGPSAHSDGVYQKTLCLWIRSLSLRLSLKEAEGMKKVEIVEGPPSSAI